METTGYHTLNDLFSQLGLASEDAAIDEFLARHRSGSLEENSIVVTFDDGYLDVLQNAVPILERYQIPATIFVVTGNLGEPFWWDRLADRQPT